MNMPENVDFFDLVTQYPGLLSPFPQVLCFLSLKPGQQKVDRILAGESGPYLFLHI